MDKGEAVNAESLTATQRFTRPPARFTEASLVKQLEERGIGRPSTYAPTISTIQKRGYVVKEPIEGKQREIAVLQWSPSGLDIEKVKENYGADKNKLHPSDIGRVVTEFLLEHFDQIMDYGFTASVEKQFDEIADGMKNWSDMIDSFYKPFHSNVSTTLETAEKATGERLLGVDPKSGLNVYARIGRFGPMVQIGSADQEEKPKFASILKGMTIDSITLDEALELFKLPRDIGEFEGVMLQANIGRFGPSIRQAKKFYSLPEEEDPMTVSLTKAVEIIEVARKEESNRIIKTFEEDDTIQVLNGKYGPYIKAGKKNVRIPKGQEPSELSYEMVQELIAKAPDKKKKR
jgi:DNA topoisomerase-1